MVDVGDSRTAVHQAKQVLRDEVRGRRAAIEHTERMRKSLVIERAVSAIDEYVSARTVLLYASTRDEVHTLGLIEKALADDKVVALPHMTSGGSLEPRRATDTGELERNRFGILEPGVRAPLIHPVTIDVAILPGVAFDAACNRLGMGKGCYDRLLPALERATTIGLAFEEQVVAAVPHETHDRAVDIVVTETRVMRRDD